MENFFGESRRHQIGLAILVLLIVLSLFVAVLFINELKRSSSIDQPFDATIAVRGDAEVFAVPDIAQFSFTAQAERSSVEEAQEEAARIANDAIEYLEDEGVNEKDIKTTFYNVNPRYEFRTVSSAPSSTGELTIFRPPGDRERVLVGYTVSQGVQVKVREADKAGELLSGVGETGVSNISGISFSIDDEDELQAEARAEAIGDAKKKAKVLARDLGVRLGKIVSFSDDVGGYPVYYESRGFGGALDAAVEEQAIAPDLPRGENTIRGNVTIIYEIK